MNSDEARLERLHIKVGLALSPELMNARISSDYDVVANKVQLAVHGYIWSERLIDVFYPRDWWQAVKNRWFPEWLRRFFPIRYVHIEGRALYPKLHQTDYVRQFKQEEL